MSLDPTKLALLLASLSNFSTTIKDRLDAKLNAIDTAVNSAKLEGKTLAEIQSLIGDDINAALAILEADFTAFVARRDNPHEVTAEQVGLGLVANYAPTTLEEAVAGLASDKYMTPAASKALLDAFWADVAGTAPETLNTINELAEALQNNPDVITALQTLIDANASEIAAVSTRVTAIEDNYVREGVTDISLNPVTYGEEGSGNLGVVLGDLASGIDGAHRRMDGIDQRISAERDTLAAADQNIQDDLNAYRTNTNATIQTLQNADSALDGRVSALEATGQTKTGTLDQNTVAFGVEGTPTQTLLTDVLAALQANIDSVAADGSADLAVLQTAFNAFVAAKASTAEVIAGTDDEKYTTSLSVKGAIDAAIADLVGTAPEALDTINELAAALQNNPDVITALQDLVAQNAQAIVDLGAVVDTKLNIADKATSADVQAGTDDVKYVTSAALKPSFDAQAQAIADNTAAIDDLMTQMAAAFDAAAADLTPEPGV